MKDEASEGEVLSVLDQAVIAHWRDLGFTIPVPELSDEVLNLIIHDLKQISKRFENLGYREW